MSDSEILLVYDAECPACNIYSQIVRIRDGVGSIKIVDARSDSAIMSEITANGLDIDQGMVLKMDEQLFYGADAIHALALISSKYGLFNKFNYWIFRSKRISRLLYPILCFCRNMLLKFLGKTKINNLNQHGNDKF